MKDAVRLTIKGLRCDANGCDYRDEKVGFDASWIDSPCPKCGASLLTREDYESIQLIIAAVAVTNAEVGPVPEDGKFVKLPITMDGTGSVLMGDITGAPDAR